MKNGMRQIGTTESVCCLIKRFVGEVGCGRRGSTRLFSKSGHALLKEGRNGSGNGSMFVVKASEGGSICHDGGR